MKKELKKYIRNNKVKKDNIIFKILFILLKMIIKTFKLIANLFKKDKTSIMKKLLFPRDEFFEYDDEYDIPSFLRDQEFLNDYIDSNKEQNSFQKTLFKMIDERNLTDSEVYNKVHIDRRLFSKIRNDNTYHPSKETVILLGLSLKLNENEIETLLKSASYYLPKNNNYDLIIRFCFIKSIYNIKDVNELLEIYKCKLLHY